MATIHELANELQVDDFEVVYALHKAIGDGKVTDSFPEEITENTPLFGSEIKSVTDYLVTV